MPTNKEQLNKSNTNNIADLLRQVGIGDVLRALPVCKRKPTLTAGALANYNGSTLSVLVLPPDAKAAFIERATVRAGTASGEFTTQAFGATPITTQCAVTPCGDIAFLGTDAPTDLDVVYTPEKGEVVDFASLPVTSNVLTIPASLTARGVVLLMEVEALTAGTTGRKQILTPGAGAPSATQARLNVAKSTITFASADAVTTARVKILVASKLDMDTFMNADANQ